MEKVPQIVSQRLKATPSAVNHPDPDVLTAFSERLLSKSERTAVVEHLARCGECREVLALALPAFEPAEETARPASSGWRTWPVLRWGFIAAGIVAIASFGVMQYQRHSSMMADQTARPEAITKEAKNLPLASPPTIPVEDREKAPAAPASIPSEQKTESSSTSSPNPSAVMTTPAAGPARAKGGATGGVLPHGPRVQWQQNTNLQQQAALQAVPPKQLRSAPAPGSGAPSGASEMVEVESAQPALSANLDSSAVQNKIDQQALQRGLTEARIERTKPAATAVANAPVFPSPAPSAKAQLIRESAQAVATSNAPTRWTISAAGRLQRSLDQGATWQDVDVNNPSAAAGANLEVMRAPSTRKEVAADSLAKKDAFAPLTFRAVSSNGPDVWAGASGGFLYHSTDAGGNWTRVVLSASGVTLTGDIVSLEFADPRHGRIVTSTPEVWITPDAGQSWQKQ
jgi:photosynthesis system II assembly factor YCF48-like protein